MTRTLQELFTDDIIIKKIKTRLPYLFRIAELESSRAGKIGMEVGSVREKIIVALLIYKFGEENLKTEIPITEAEVDVILFDKPISIKTMTGKSFSGLKLIWTVDAQKSFYFQQTYSPGCDMIFVNINWNDDGGFYFIPLNVQTKIFNKLGREKYIKLPKEGTNPRGIEMKKDALMSLIKDPETQIIKIKWEKSNIDYLPFKRWVELWDEE